MSESSASAEVSLGRQGRLVIPAPLRRSLGLVLEKPEQIKHRLKARFAQVPLERRLVDELIAERREESRREGVG